MRASMGRYRNYQAGAAVDVSGFGPSVLSVGYSVRLASTRTRKTCGRCWPTNGASAREATSLAGTLYPVGRILVFDVGNSMKKKLLFLAVTAALSASVMQAQASTLTITDPTTVSSSSLSSSTNLDFAASSGQQASLTDDLADGFSYTATSSTVGSISMNTNGDLILSSGGSGGDRDAGINIESDGTTPTGAGMLTVTETGGLWDLTVAVEGDNPISGSLFLDNPMTSASQGTESLLDVGGSLNQYDEFNAGSTPSTLTLNDLNMTSQAPDIDIQGGSTLTVDKLLFNITNLDTSESTDGSFINITNTNTTGDTLQNNTVNVGNVSFAGGTTDTNDGLTLNDAQAGNGTFNIGSINANQLTFEDEPVSNGTNVTYNVGALDVDSEVSNKWNGSATGSSTINFKPTVDGGGDYDASMFSFFAGDNGVGQSLTVNLDGDTANGPVNIAPYGSSFAYFSAVGGGTDSAGTPSAVNFYGDVNMGMEFSTTGTAVSLSKGALASATDNFSNSLTVGSQGEPDNAGSFNIGSNVTVNDTGDADFYGQAPVTGMGEDIPLTYTTVSVAQNAALNVSGGLSASYAAFNFNITPSQAWGINVGGNYNIQNSQFTINATSGAYKNGAKYALIPTSGKGTNTFSGNAFYYVYDGSSSTTIDGLKPYAESTPQGLYLCLGGACVAPSTPSSSPSPAPKPAPTPAPSTPTPAPIIIPVRVVTPAQEAAKQPVIAQAPTTSINLASDVSGDLLSTGVIGGGPRGLWGKALGGTSSQGNDSGYNYGLLIGYGFSVGPDHRDLAGLAFSYMHNAFGSSASNETTSNDYGLWAYGTIFSPHAHWKITGTIGGGLSSNSMQTKSLGFPISATYGGSWFTAATRASYWKHYGKWVVSPRLSLSYASSNADSYTTSGGFLSVHVGSASSGVFSASPAVLIGKQVKLDGTDLFPQLRAGIVENIGSTPSAIVTSGAATATASGLPLAHTQGTLEARLDIGGNPDRIKQNRWSGYVAVKQLFGGGQSSTEATATIKYYW
jgi:hypothetical protein